MVIRVRIPYAVQLTSHKRGFFIVVTVYIIESLQDQTWYTGMALDAIKRLSEHNAGKNRFTKGHRPWRIIYSETFDSWASGRAREKYFKTAAGKKWLKARLLHGGDTGSLPA